MPRWLVVAYTAWMAVWVPTIWIHDGVGNFLWLCDVANFVVLIALWRGSALLFSSQAVGLAIIQTVWMVDFFGRLLFGVHPIGGTQYMFEAAKPLWLRSMSLFHVWMPLLLLWALLRLGYDRRALRLQTAITWLVLPLSLLADPARNLNWLHEPFGVPQIWLPTAAWLLLSLALYPLLLYLPVHLLLRRLFPAPARSW